MSTIRYTSVALVIAGAISAFGAVTFRTAATPDSLGSSSGASNLADEDTFTMALPDGWNKVGDDHGQPRITRFENAEGLWFDVIAFNDRDPFGSEFVTDQVWALGYNPTRDGFRIKQIGARCEPGPLCTAGDGRYQGYALLRDDDNMSTVTDFVRGHVFQFDFGGPGESLDPSVFRSMIESFRIK